MFGWLKKTPSPAPSAAALAESENLSDDSWEPYAPPSAHWTRFADMQEWGLAAVDIIYRARRVIRGQRRELKGFQNPHVCACYSVSIDDDGCVTLSDLEGVKSLRVDSSVLQCAANLRRDWESRR